MSIFGDSITSLLRKDPSTRDILKIKDFLAEHRKNAETASEEERKMAEEATAFLRMNNEDPNS